MKFLFLFIFSFLSVFAGSKEEIHTLVQKGLEDCYSFRWDKADDSFDKIVKKYPGDLRGYHYKSILYFWSYFSNNTKDDFEKFISYSDTTIAKGREQLEANPDDDQVLYTMGTCYSYRMMAYAKAENYMDAVLASKKIDTYLHDALKVNPKLSDAYLGLGLYNFAMGQIPSYARWALTVAGIKGDKATGLKYIKKAAAEGVLSRVEAQYYYSQILSEVLMDYNSAAVYLKRLNSKYPDNLLFSYSLAVIDIKKRSLGQAEPVLRRIVKEKNPGFKQLIAFSNFLLGDVYYRRNDFGKAIQYYTIFLNTAQNKDYTGIASFRLAVSLEATGNRNEAVKYFNRTGHGNADIEDDIYAKRKGDVYSKRTMAGNEIAVIKASNLVEQGSYKAAYDSLLKLTNIVKSEKLKAEAYLNLSEASYMLNKPDESIKYAGEIKDINSSEERWIRPFAAYYEARAYLKLKDSKNAKKYIDETEDYSDYDYQKKLDNMIDALKIAD